MSSIYRTVTERIIKSLKDGSPPWVRPWSVVSRDQNALTGRTYSCVNSMLLAVEREHREWEHGLWLTFRQAKQLGGFVRKGERAVSVVLWKLVEVEDDLGDRKGTTEATRTIPVVRTFPLFNVEQCKNLPDALIERHLALPNTGDRIARVDAFVRATGARIVTTQGGASYAPAADVIAMPKFETFKSPEHHAATILHEISHWSGAPGRCARDLVGRFGTVAYAAEELIAELASAYLCAEFHLDGDLQHASYVGHWIRLLQSDDRAIFRAASEAERAAKFLLDLADRNGAANAA